MRAVHLPRTNGYTTFTACRSLMGIVISRVDVRVPCAANRTIIYDPRLWLPSLILISVPSTVRSCDDLRFGYRQSFVTRASTYLPHIAPCAFHTSRADGDVNI